MKIENIKNIPKLRFPEFRNAPEWREKKLGEEDISIFVNKKISVNKLKIDAYISTENILSDFSGIKLASKLPTTGSFTKFKERDVLISNIRPYLKKIWKADKNGAASNDVIVIRAGSKVKCEFLEFILKNETFINYIMISAKGMKMPRGDKNSIQKYTVMITSFPEQQKIADCLSSLDDLITAEGKKLGAYKAHKKGLMQRLFPAEGKNVPRLRFPEFRGCGEWVETTLANMSDFRRGSFPQPYGLPEWYDNKNGIPFIQVFDVDDNLRLKQTTKNKISKLATKQSVFIPKGTVIITIQGSIGRVAITQYDAYIDRTLLLFEKFYEVINKIFFAYILQMLFEIEKQKAPGGIIKTITKEVLSDFVIKMPHISEQQKIADCLSSLDDLITAQAEKVEALKAHKKGLMQGLFPAVEEVGG